MFDLVEMVPAEISGWSVVFGGHPENREIVYIIN